MESRTRPPSPQCRRLKNPKGQSPKGEIPHATPLEQRTQKSWAGQGRWGTAAPHGAHGGRGATNDGASRPPAPRGLSCWRRACICSQLACLFAEGKEEPRAWQVRTDRANHNPQFLHVSKQFDQVQSLNARKAHPHTTFFSPCPSPARIPKGSWILGCAGRTFHT